MPFYVSDYLADTSHLSTLEHGAYMLLIMHYWRSGGLPDDEQKLARICRMTTRQWDAVRGTIAEFFGEGWTHSRIDKEITHATEKSERRSASGHRGGLSKSLKNKESYVANATVLPQQTPSIALASSSQPQPESEIEEKVVGLKTNIVGFENQKSKKKTNNAPDYPPAFNLLWREFPYQENASKKDAYSAWLRLPEEDRDKCLDGALAYSAWLDGQRKKRADYPGKHLSTFINSRVFDSLLEARH